MILWCIYPPFHFTYSNPPLFLKIQIVHISQNHISATSLVLLTHLNLTNPTPLLSSPHPLPGAPQMDGFLLDRYLRHWGKVQGSEPGIFWDFGGPTWCMEGTIGRGCVFLKGNYGKNNKNRICYVFKHNSIDVTVVVLFCLSWVFVRYLGYFDLGGHAPNTNVVSCGF